jgi:SET domain-containing protein
LLDRSVDATKSKRIGRLINHSQKHYNLKTKLYVVDETPHLGLVATRVKLSCRLLCGLSMSHLLSVQQITPKEELLYDYGERNPDTLKALPWLKQ